MTLDRYDEYRNGKRDGSRERLFKPPHVGAAARALYLAGFNDARGLPRTAQMPISERLALRALADAR